MQNIIEFDTILGECILGVRGVLTVSFSRVRIYSRFCNMLQITLSKSYLNPSLAESNDIVFTPAIHIQYV